MPLQLRQHFLLNNLKTVIVDPTGVSRTLSPMLNQLSQRIDREANGLKICFNIRSILLKDGVVGKRFQYGFA